MALQSDAIESRLEGLKQDDVRMMFDSQLRAIRRDCKPPIPFEDRGPKPARKAEIDPRVDQMIVLLEELSRRIDCLEKKNRALGDEVRQRARKDKRHRSMVTAGGVAVAAIGLACWWMRWF